MLYSSLLHLPPPPPSKSTLSIPSLRLVLSPESIGAPPPSPGVKLQRHSKHRLNEHNIYLFLHHPSDPTRLLTHVYRLSIRDHVSQNQPSMIRLSTDQRPKKKVNDSFITVVCKYMAMWLKTSGRIMMCVPVPWMLFIPIFFPNDKSIFSWTRIFIGTIGIWNRRV